MSAYPPSPDEDDHLTIKKLRTQHFQSSGPYAPASLTLVQPSRPVQLAIPAQLSISTPFLATIVELEDSDEEQGLQGLRTNIFNKISSSVQVLVTSTPARPKQSKQPAAEQITNQVAELVAAKQDSLSAEPHTCTLLEQAKSTSTE